MMRALKPWAYGPFEILLHAEMHYRVGEDFDRRIAMIGFDNALEVAVTTYLSLHPVQRGRRAYKNEDVDKWLKNYHTKMEFFFQECTTRSVIVVCKHDEIIWFHDVRNGQYHGGGATIPQRRELDGCRAAAIEVFSILFDEAGVDALLDAYIAAKSPVPPPPRTEDDDRMIDDEYGMVQLCGEPQYTSDLLYALDANRYREVALELKSTDAELPKKEPS